MNQTHPFPIGTQVVFDIAEGHAIGKAVIISAVHDDGWLYCLDVFEGDRANDHRNERGELWVCDFEVQGT